MMIDEDTVWSTTVMV